MAHTEFDKTKVNVAVALILTLVLPGLGLRYIGKKSEGNYQIVGAGVLFSVLYAVLYLGYLFSILFGILWCIPAICYYFYCLRDAYRKAKEHNHRLEYEKYIDRRKLLKEVMWGKKPE
jgi:predicted membrane protein